MNGAHRGRRPHDPPRQISGEHHLQIASLPTRRRSAAHGRHRDEDPPELVGEIHTLEGPDAERVALQQARVFREVTAWMARTPSSQERERAA